MKALSDLDIFVRTADNASLSATARALDLTPAAASAALKRLEAELGVPLFLRSTRSLRLTPHGERFLAQGRPALQALQQAGAQLAAGEQGFKGLLKLSAPSDLGRNVLLPWLDEFQTAYPEVELRLQLSDRMANVFSEPVDAAFRYGKPPDSSLVALPLALENRRVLCASPA
jgi:DNA-binding transcriptional LysR family regulator